MIPIAALFIVVYENQLTYLYHIERFVGCLDFFIELLRSLMVRDLDGG